MVGGLVEDLPVVQVYMIGDRWVDGGPLGGSAGWWSVVDGSVEDLSLGRWFVVRRSIVGGRWSMVL